MFVWRSSSTSDMTHETRTPLAGRSGGSRARCVAARRTHHIPAIALASAPCASTYKCLLPPARGRRGWVRQPHLPRRVSLCAEPPTMPPAAERAPRDTTPETTGGTPPHTPAEPSPLTARHNLPRLSQRALLSTPPLPVCGIHVSTTCCPHLHACAASRCCSP